MNKMGVIALVGLMLQCMPVIGGKINNLLNTKEKKVAAGVAIGAVIVSGAVICHYLYNRNVEPKKIDEEADPSLGAAVVADVRNKRKAAVVESSGQGAAASSSQPADEGSGLGLGRAGVPDAAAELRQARAKREALEQSFNGNLLDQVERLSRENAQLREKFVELEATFQDVADLKSLKEDVELLKQKEIALRELRATRGNASSVDGDAKISAQENAQNEELDRALASLTVVEQRVKEHSQLLAKADMTTLAHAAFRTERALKLVCDELNKNGRVKINWHDLMDEAMKTAGADASYAHQTREALQILCRVLKAHNIPINWDILMRKAQRDLTMRNRDMRVLASKPGQKQGQSQAASAAQQPKAGAGSASAGNAKTKTLRKPPTQPEQKRGAAQAAEAQEESAGTQQRRTSKGWQAAQGQGAVGAGAAGQPRHVSFENGQDSGSDTDTEGGADADVDDVLTEEMVAGFTEAPLVSDISGLAQPKRGAAAQSTTRSEGAVETERVAADHVAAGDMGTQAVMARSLAAAKSPSKSADDAADLLFGTPFPAVDISAQSASETQTAAGEKTSAGAGAGAGVVAAQADADDFDPAAEA